MKAIQGPHLLVTIASGESLGYAGTVDALGPGANTYRNPFFLVRGPASWPFENPQVIIICSKAKYRTCCSSRKYFKTWILTTKGWVACCFWSTACVDWVYAICRSTCCRTAGWFPAETASAHDVCVTLGTNEWVRTHAAINLFNKLTHSYVFGRDSFHPVLSSTFKAWLRWSSRCLCHCFMYFATRNRFHAVFMDKQTSPGWPNLCLELLIQHLHHSTSFPLTGGHIHLLDGAKYRVLSGTNYVLASLLLWSSGYKKSISILKNMAIPSNEMEKKQGAR